MTEVKFSIEHIYLYTNKLIPLIHMGKKVH